MFLQISTSGYTLGQLSDLRSFRPEARLPGVLLLGTTCPGEQAFRRKDWLPVKQTASQVHIHPTSQFTFSPNWISKYIIKDDLALHAGHSVQPYRLAWQINTTNVGTNLVIFCVGRYGNREMKLIRCGVRVYKPFFCSLSVHRDRRLMPTDNRSWCDLESERNTSCLWVSEWVSEWVRETGRERGGREVAIVSVCVMCKVAVLELVEMRFALQLEVRGQ